mgnify:CR=1 FL=1
MNQNKNRVNYRFPFWLTVIFLLLILIPFAILSDKMILAKISGLLCLLVVIIAMRFWFHAAKLNSGVKTSTANSGINPTIERTFSNSASPFSL